MASSATLTTPRRSARIAFWLGVISFLVIGLWPIETHPPTGANLLAAMSRGLLVDDVDRCAVAAHASIVFGPSLAMTAVGAIGLIAARRGR